MKKHIMLVLALIITNLALAQITFFACSDSFTSSPNVYTFSPEGTDATGRNYYQTNPITGDQPCSAGACEFRIAWNDGSSRWEILLVQNQADFSDAIVVYHNSSASSPNPPSLNLGTWDDTTSACGGVLTTTNGALSGDVQDSLTLCIDPEVPTVTYSQTTVCSGNSATLNISGALNDATQWAIYTGSCGGTLVSTTVGSSFVVTPSSPYTTYYVRGEGGCVTPGSCGTVTVNVTPIDNASFNYGEIAYCVSDSDPIPTITGVGDGTFSSTEGLSISASTGVIDLSASTPSSTYVVTYTTTGSCPNSSSFSVTISQVDVSTSLRDATMYSNAVGANAVGATYQWLDCDNGMSIIEGETNSSYTAIANGSYAVQVALNGCSDVSECVTITTLGVATNSFSNEIKIYPNPASQTIFVSSSVEPVKEIILYSLFGGKVLTVYGTDSLDVSQLSKGLYLIQVTTNSNKTIQRKVVIN